MTEVERPLWVVSELYHPEETSTGYLLTRTAEGLAAGRAVRVLCAQPTYSRRGLRAPAREARHGVDIERCVGTTLDKDVLAFRVLNMLTISASIFLAALRRFRRQDLVLVVTNPPLLPFAVALAAWIRGARCLLLIHDVYPEVLVASGLARPRSPLVWLTRVATRRLYESMTRIIVLGRDMKRLAAAKLHDAERRVVVIPNWADVDEIHPQPRADNPLLAEAGLAEQFVVQYAGNMGRTHAIEILVEAAARLSREARDVRFLFIGSGAKKAWLERAVRERRLTNVTVQANRPRSEQQLFLTACDVAVISFVPGMAGVSVPSRMYNIMAAGRPILAVADDGSELARVVREERVGWVVPPGDVGGLVAAVQEAAADPARLAAMGAQARAAAEARYSFRSIIERYEGLCRDLGAA